MAVNHPARSCAVPGADAQALSELEPLLQALRENRRVTEPTRFTRGTLLPDGRLDLCKQGLGPEGARAVVEALRQNTVVASVLMGADAIGNEGAMALAELLQANSAITTAFLGCNGIDASGVDALAQALTSGSPLRGLWLKRNALGDAGVTKLAQALRGNTRLTTLDLVQTRFGLEGGTALATALTISNGTLERLSLSGNQLTDADVPWLARLAAGAPSLTALFLSANRLGDVGLTALAPSFALNRRLTELAVGANALTAAGLHAICDALRTHPTLKVLDLGRSASADPAGARPDAITDESVFFLATLIRETPRLQSLTIDGTRLSESAVNTLLDALEENETITHLNLQRRLASHQRQRLQELLERHRRKQPLLEVPADVLAVRSVYRKGGGPAAEPPRPKAPAVPNTVHETTPLTVTPEEIETCIRVLRELNQQPGRFFVRDSGLNPVRAEANRIVESIRRESDVRRAARSSSESKAAKEQRKAHDRTVVEHTGMRQMRFETAPMLPAPPSEAPPVGLLLKPRHCYICKDAYHEVHPYYDSLCPSCAALNAAKRVQTTDLRGKTALITGGRIKIGYEVALMLLRAGAKVITTSRFPVDTARRFAQEKDYEEWRDRLEIHGIDLRDIRAVERFAETLANDLGRLDILINNAAQTVRRPSEFYRHLLDAEARGPQSLAPEVAETVAPSEYHQGQTAVPAAALSQVPLTPEDLVSDQNLFPLATFDRHGQQRDLRDVNSWTMKVGEIATNEVMETHFVNAIAPFVIINRLLPLMERTPGKKFVVNVSAMEGKFDYARKQSTHPHTNMAKASLNMLTRTAASSLAERGIFMTSVDTGWVTNENPYAMTEAMRANLQFEPPLDEIDGAARVLDPIFSAEEKPLHGLFLKDYKPTTW